MTDNAISQEIVDAAFRMHTTLRRLTEICFIKPSRRADKRFGLLINFHAALIKHGITRIGKASKTITQSRRAAKRRRNTCRDLLGISRGTLGYA